MRLIDLLGFFPTLLAATDASCTARLANIFGTALLQLLDNLLEAEHLTLPDLVHLVLDLAPLGADLPFIVPSGILVLF